MMIRLITVRRGGHNRVAIVAFMVAVFAVCGTAQTSEFLPEIDVYAKLNPTVRLSFQAKHTREDGGTTQAEVGPSIDFYVKPLLSLRKASSHDLDESKSRAVVLSFGYRYMPSPNSPAVNRIIFQGTSNLPFKANLLMSNRSRGEINISNGSTTWRYRNRSTIQHSVNIGSYHPALYASGEVYYASSYQKWSSTALYAGVLLPMRKHLQLDTYYEHENNTGKRPNQQINALGLALALHF
jgi:hypothetical protein